MQIINSLKLSPSETKFMIKLFLLLFIVFGSIALYLSLNVFPVNDAVYSDIYGIEEVGH